MAANPFRHDPGQASKCGRIGGYAKAAKYPKDQLTAAARRGFMARFEPTDPDLDDVERERRTKAAFKAHMMRLAYLSAKKRGIKKKSVTCIYQTSADDPILDRVETTETR